MHLSKFSAVDAQSPKKVDTAGFRTIWSTVFIVRQSPKTNVSRLPQEAFVYAPAPESKIKIYCCC